jgi:hypothetical protein
MDLSSLVKALNSGSVDFSTALQVEARIFTITSPQLKQTTKTSAGKQETISTQNQPQTMAKKDGLSHG